MRQVIIICHNDHLISRSHDFITRLLESDFEVHTIPYDQGFHYIEISRKLKADAVFLLWQTEFMAPWFLANGHKVACFPMFDGCANAPSYYFKLLKESYLFNFSKGLHTKSIQAGAVSYLLNYYPYPEPNISSSNQKKNQLFYWLRRPNSSLAESSISHYFSPYVDKIHIHDRPDAYQVSKNTHLVETQFISISKWFEKKEDLYTLINDSKFYLAPRETEGIGMAFLEAMSMGCIVFANKNSTHDQYIYHGHNGFLIDFESGNKKLIKKQIKEAFKIINSGKPVGENAQKFIEHGQGIWQKQANQIKQTFITIDNNKKLKPQSILKKVKAYILVKSFYKSPNLYYSVLYLFAKFSRKYNSKSLLSFLKRLRKP